jgi:hypothetical protein
MPRPTEKRIKGQKEVESQKTFDFTVPKKEIHARRVDPLERQFMSPEAKGIMTFVNQTNRTAQAGMILNTMVVDEQRKKGYATKGRGEKAPEGSHWAFMEGYEKMSGQAAVADFEIEMDELVNTSGEDDPQTFNNKREHLTKKYLSGSSDSFIEAFVPRATALDSKAQQAYQSFQYKKLQGDFLTKSMKILKMDFKDLKDTKNRSAKQRALVSALQSKAKGYGLSKNQVSEAIVKTIGSQNAMTGHPENLLFLFEPDKDGNIAIADNPKLAGAVHQYVDEAITTRQSLEREERLVKERVQKKYALDAGKSILDSIDKGDPTEASQLLEATGQHMGFDMYKGLKKALNDLREGSDTYFATYTDQTTFDILRIKARYGKLDMNELATFQSALNKQDYRTVFGDIIHHMDERHKTGSKAGKKSITETTTERVRSAGSKVTMQRDKLDQLLNPETAVFRNLHYEILFGDLYKDMVEKQGGRSKLTAEDMTLISQRALWGSFDKFPPRNKEKMPINPDDKNTSKDGESTNKSNDSLDDWLNEKE